jgi:hypothetical protein
MPALIFPPQAHPASQGPRISSLETQCRAQVRSYDIDSSAAASPLSASTFDPGRQESSTSAPYSSKACFRAVRASWLITFLSLSRFTSRSSALSPKAGSSKNKGSSSRLPWKLSTSISIAFVVLWTFSRSSCEHCFVARPTSLRSLSPTSLRKLTSFTCASR